MDSIYVEREYRKKKIGQRMVERALNWLKIKEAVNLEVKVAFGNEDIFKFYKKFKFYPRQIILEKKI
ncbi:MAG: GNAT family N-acetyltransferase [Methanobacteriaceae archaeon]|nr:GNAT family N-acetyltransferase [Methanobacteriaceae archaeon]